ncbi:MAG: hypothetical protein HKN09_04935, partial [Saprospiraceae bacterium]|nr:hypothetical protein [Saprospiraceae bacterium]
MRRIIMHLCLCLFLFSCSDDATETQTITLQTDGYFPAGLYNFVGIDTPGEEVAITLGPLSNSYQVTHIQFLFGGTGNTPSQRDVILKIYNDNGSVIPGSLIHSSEYTLANHNTLLQELDVSSEN